jgi:peptidoglycan/LPS O-acetylase OafA/YrhL
MSSTVQQCWVQQPFHVMLLHMLQGGIISSAAIMFLMTVAMTRAGAPGRLLHAVLAAPFWKPLAELSYSAYLYHEQVRH